MIRRDEIDIKRAVAALRPVRSAASTDYVERVYAGVLGKLIGVYLGRPVENWSYERIREEFGEIDYYVHEKRDRLLIVTDDDISGTFVFLRALRDYGCSRDLSARQIGQTWLNYLIEETTILWWGGLGNSTEHTAYLRLKSGVRAPESGSATLNSRTVAEQIGAQIFIDGWGFVCPGDPEGAADFAAKAARVSHDGEAVYGAQVIAAMVAEAFIEPDIHRVLNRAIGLIPSDSTIARLIDDVREWHAKEGDWRENRARLEAEYGYDKYRGQCHIVPNHGLIILSLLHGGGDFDESMTIVNSGGWDTDCNAGNVGAILGVLGGLDGLQGKDWRGPVADRLYLPSAEGGGAISDAVREAVTVANYGRALAGVEPLVFKNGARFHFGLSGCVQGWQSHEGSGVEVSHFDGRLRLVKSEDGPGMVGTATFVPREIRDLKSGYVLVASPTLYPSQTVKAVVGGVGSGRLFASVYDEEDELQTVWGPEFEVNGDDTSVSWTMPDTGGQPIAEIGIAVASGELLVDQVDWSGVPETSFPALEKGTMWSRAWAKGVHRFTPVRDRYEWLVMNEGAGLLSIGMREWSDYEVEARVTPKMAVSAGIAVRVQGLRRYYAAVFGAAGELRLDKVMDGHRVLATTSFPWQEYGDYEMRVAVRGNEISVYVNGQMKLSAVDTESPLMDGAFGFVVESGCMGAGTPRIRPL